MGVGLARLGQPTQQVPLVTVTKPLTTPCERSEDEGMAS